MAFGLPATRGAGTTKLDSASRRAPHSRLSPPGCGPAARSPRNVVLPTQEVGPRGADLPKRARSSTLGARPDPVDVFVEDERITSIGPRQIPRPRRRQATVVPVSCTWSVRMLQIKSDCAFIPGWPRQPVAENLDAWCGTLVTTASSDFGAVDLDELKQVGSGPNEGYLPGFSGSGNADLRSCSVSSRNVWSNSPWNASGEATLWRECASSWMRPRMEFGGPSIRASSPLYF